MMSCCGRLRTPGLVANMVGSENARRGSMRLFDVLQRRPLNKHLMYTIFDEVVWALFPELAASQPAGVRSPQSTD